MIKRKHSELLFLFAEYLQHKGVECYFDNERLVSSAHVVIFCVLPSQMPGVCEDIKDYISSSLIMICAFSSLTLRRLRQMLGSSNVIQPKLDWKEDISDLNYNYSLNVNIALESRDTVLGTCPIGVEKEGKLSCLIHHCDCFSFHIINQQG